jgi:hypothetical protein
MHFPSYFVTYGLFHDAVQNRRMTDELKSGKDCVQNRQWLNLRHYVRTCFEELRENTIFSV